MAEKERGGGESIISEYWYLFIWGADVSYFHIPLSRFLYICNFIKNETESKTNMLKLKALFLSP